MARQKLISDEDAIKYIDYIVNIQHNGNPTSIKFSDIARYISEQTHINIEGRILSRNPVIKKHLEDLRNVYLSKSSILIDYKPISYEEIKALPVDAKIKTMIIELNNRNNHLFDTAADLKAELEKSKKECTSLNATLSELQKQLQQFKGDKKEKSDKIKALQSELKTLKEFIKTTVTPECIAILSKDYGISLEINNVDENRFVENLIHADSEISLSEEINNNIINLLWEEDK